MADSQLQEPVCKSVFKSGGKTIKTQFTGKWIELINASEKNRELTSPEPRA